MQRKAIAFDEAPSMDRVAVRTWHFSSQIPGAFGIEIALPSFVTSPYPESQ
jgi:hypothetical protein